MTAADRGLHHQFIQCIQIGTLTLQQAVTSLQDSQNIHFVRFELFFEML